MLKIHKFEPRHLASKRTLPWSCHRSLCEADYLAKWKCHLIERWNWEDHPTMAQGGLTFQGKMTPWWAWVFRVPGFISGRCWQPHSQIKPGEICCRIHRFSETWSQYHQTKGTHISCFNWDGSWNSTADHYFPQILAGSEPATVIHKSRQHQTWFWLDNFWIRLQECPNFGVFFFWLQVKSIMTSYFGLGHGFQLIFAGKSWPASSQCLKNPGFWSCALGPRGTRGGVYVSYRCHVWSI